MALWRNHKRKGRADIHRAFALPAVYLTHTAGVPVPCNVRVHSKVAANQTDFAWPNTAGYLEIDPYIIFDGAEIPKPLKNAYVFASESEIYRLGVAEPYREQFAKVDVNRLTADECTALVVVLAQSFAQYEDEWAFVLNNNDALVPAVPPTALPARIPPVSQEPGNQIEVLDDGLYVAPILDSEEW
jgi:hypothetical protein